MPLLRVDYIDVNNDIVKINLKELADDSTVTFDSLEDKLKAEHLSEANYNAEIRKFRDYVKKFSGVPLKTYDSYDAELVGPARIWYRPKKMFVILAKPE